MARPALRLRIAPKFPTRIIGGTGIDVANTGGATTIAMDWSGFQGPIGPFDPGPYDILAYNAAAGEFNLVPLSTSRTANYRLVTIAGPVTVTTSDGIIGIDKTVAETTTVNLLPAAGSFPLTIKDVGGDAGNFNITLDPSGAETIDGAATFVMNSNFQSIMLTPVPGGWISNAEYSGNTAVVPGTYTFAAITVDARGRVTFVQSGNVPTAPVGVLSNASLAAAVASNALTITLRDATGATPSLDSGVSIPFRSATAATGSLVQRTVGSATSLVISSGSTMGFANATAGRLWIVAFDDAGTVRLGAINCRSGVNVFKLGQMGIASSTAEGGAGAADSAQVFYTGTAVTAKAYTVLGYMEWSAGLTTAGTWGIVPTSIETFRPGMKLPGDIVQTCVGETNAFNSNAATIPFDDTPPQIGEGTQAVSVAIVPSSAANVMVASSGGTVGNNTSGVAVGLALFRSDQTDALCAASSAISGVNLYEYLSVRRLFLAATTSSITMSSRFGGSSGTSAINGGSARQFGTSQVFAIEAAEIVA